MKILLKIVLLVLLSAVVSAEIVEVQKIGGKYSFVSDAAELIKINVPPKLKERYPAEVLKAIETEGVSVQIDFKCSITDKSGFYQTEKCSWKEVVYSDNYVGVYYNPKMKSEFSVLRVKLVVIVVSIGLMLLSNLLVFLIHKYKLMIVGVVAITAAMLASLVASLGSVIAIVAAFSAFVAGVVAMGVSRAEVLGKFDFRMYITFSSIFYILSILSYVGTY